MKPQTGKLCWGRVKGNTQLLKFKLHHVMSIENSNEPGLMTTNSLVKINKHGKCAIFILNNTNKRIVFKKREYCGKNLTS